jgi:hypothetical protein
VTVLFFDLDCYVRAADPLAPPAEPGMTLATAFARAVQRYVAELYADSGPDVAQCVVAATPPVKDDKHGNGSCKVGVHLYWPKIRVTVAQHRAVRRFVVKELTRTMHKDDLVPGWTLAAEWADIVDFKVLAKRNLRMIGSDKLEQCKCKPGEGSLCDHLKPSAQAKRAFKFNPLKRYRFISVLDHLTEVDAQATARYRCSTFELLRDVSLCWPRHGEAMTRCAVDANFALDEMGLEEGGHDDEAEDAFKWQVYDASNEQHMRILNILLRHVLVFDGKPSTPEADRLGELVDRSPAGFQVGTMPHSHKRLYKLIWAAGRPCMNRCNEDGTDRGHSSERPYYLMDTDGKISIRCGCKCVDTTGRRTLGTLKPVQCSRVQFDFPQLGPIGVLKTLPLETADEKKRWERNAKQLFLPRKTAHPDCFRPNDTLDALDNLTRVTSSTNHIRSLRPAHRYSSGMPDLCRTLQRDIPIEGEPKAAADATSPVPQELADIPTAHGAVVPIPRRAHKRRRKVDRPQE